MDFLFNYVKSRNMILEPRLKNDFVDRKMKMSWWYSVHMPAVLTGFSCFNSLPLARVWLIYYNSPRPLSSTSFNLIHLFYAMWPMKVEKSSVGKLSNVVACGQKFWALNRISTLQSVNVNGSLKTSGGPSLMRIDDNGCNYQWWTGFMPGIVLTWRPADPRHEKGIQYEVIRNTPAARLSVNVPDTGVGKVAARSRRKFQFYILPTLYKPVTYFSVSLFIFVYCTYIYLYKVYLMKFYELTVE
jgi:hypothetical protein